MYYSTKTWNDDEGWSTCFRQWRATNADGSKSHCAELHGYSISVGLRFYAPSLDHRNWVVAFGDLKKSKAWLKDQLDHTTLVAKSDPELDYFKEGARRGVMKLLILSEIGCECLSEYVYDKIPLPFRPGAFLESVEVREHSGNSAIYSPQTHRELT